jgi:hypothetical protein
MSLLTVTQDAMLLCGLPQPTVALSNTDLTVLQFVAFAQKEADETWTDFNWRQSRIPAQLVGDGTTTLFALPSDFERMLAGPSLWSAKYPSIPLQWISDLELLALKALPVMPVRPVCRLIGGTLEIWPALASTETVSLEYYSTNPLCSSDGLTRKPRWTSDSDFSLFPEGVLMRGVIWRWKQSKGLDYAEDFRTWSLERDKKASHDGGARVVQMTNTFTIGPNDWPGVITVITP